MSSDRVEEGLSDKHIDTKATPLKMDAEAGSLSTTAVAVAVEKGIDPDIPRLMAQITPERRAEIEKKVVRKIDLILFPNLLIFYILNYLDRSALGFAKLVGIEADLNLSSTEFATCLSILYVGYCLFQIPSNLMLSKSKPALYLPTCMLIWGIVSGCSAAVHNYTGLVTTRFFLGIVEAPFFPGAVYLISSWYTREEMASRCAILFGGNFISNAVGSLLALGVTENMNGVHGFQSWRWLFLIESIMTVGVALASYFILPNYPHNTWWLKGEERAVAVWRLAEDVGQADDTQGTEGDKTGTLKGFKMAVSDWKTWILTLNHTLITIGAGIVVFYPTVVGTLGFSRKITYALIAPPYLLAFVVTYIGCRSSDIRQERTWHMVGTIGVTLVGLIILAATLNTGARYFSLFLVTCFVYISYNSNLAWISNCIPRPASKRAASIAIVNMVAQSGNIIAGYIYPNDQAPRYWMACTIEAAALLGAIVTTVVMRFLLKKENRKLEERERAMGGDVASSDRFRYLI